MTRLVASALVAAVIVHGAPVSAAVLMAGEASRPPLLSGCALETGTQADTLAALRNAARRIPLDGKVRVTLASGGKLEGRLRIVGETGVTIERQTRYPVPPIEVAFDQMQSIEHRTGLGWGAKSAIIAGTAGAALLILFALTFGCAGC